jgi:uncharacterized protein (TIGR02145 family)
MSNSFKAFIRWDRQGRIVPSTLFLGKHKPKVGDWEEVPTSIECWECTTTTTTTTIAPLEYLYNWYAASDAKNIANVDWHIPTLAEFQTFYGFVGASTFQDKTKEDSLLYWNSILNVTNSTKFNARGVGIRLYQNGVWGGIKNNLYLLGVTGTTCITLNYTSGTHAVSVTNGDNKVRGCSIRLLKNTTILLPGEEGTYIGNNGKIYRTICIGTQEWLADNLAETKYRDGSSISYVADNSAWMALTTEAYCTGSAL